MNRTEPALILVLLLLILGVGMSSLWVGVSPKQAVTTSVTTTETLTRTLELRSTVTETSFKTVTESHVTTVLATAPQKTVTETVTKTVTVNFTTTLIASPEANAVRIFEMASKSVASITVYNERGEPASMGSGFVYDQTGHVVTNNHVVEGGTSFVATFLDGSMVEAQVVGTDRYGDLAVLRVKLPKGIVPLPLGDSLKLRVGEPVYAVGSPFGFKGSITEGIVSQLNRTLETIPAVIQTDAPINPGNSGGPLLNIRGEVIGVNSAGIAKSISEGLGFAIPSSLVKRIVPSLLSSGKYLHPFIGVNGVSLDPIVAKSRNLPYERGFLITGIFEGTGAARSTLQIGDVLVAVQGYVVRDAGDLSFILEHYTAPGDAVKISVLRKDARLDIEVTLGARPL